MMRLLRAAVLLGAAGLALSGCVMPTPGPGRLAGLPVISSALDPNAAVPTSAPRFLLTETSAAVPLGWNIKTFTGGYLYTVGERRKPFGSVTNTNALLFLDNGAPEVLALSPDHDVLVWSADYDRQTPPGAPDLYRGVHLFSVASGDEFADLGDDIERSPLRQGDCAQDTIVLAMKNLLTQSGVSPAEIAASSWIAGFFSLPVGQTSWLEDIAWTAPDELRVQQRLEVVTDIPPRRFSLGLLPFDVRYKVAIGQRPRRLSCTVLTVGGPLSGPTVSPGPSSVSGSPRFAFRGQTVLEELPRGQNGPVPLRGRPVGAFLFPDPPVP